MVRHGRAAGLDEPADAPRRLAALALRTGVVGWVPEPVVDAVARESIATPFVESLAEPLVVSSPPPSPVTNAPVVAPPALGELARAWAVDRLPPGLHGTVERVRLGTLVVAAAVVGVAILGAVILLHRGSSGTYPSYDGSSSGSSYSPSSSGPQSPTTPVAATDATSIVVDVGGRVRKPGLVTLPAGARVADAIAAAGGPLHHREIATLDLAARVTDGQLLLIGVKDTGTATGGSDDTSGAADSSTGGAAAPVDLDSATLTELEALPGVGPVTAQKILDWRTAHSGFTAVEQLQQISGIGPAKYAEISPLVTP
jgi:competence protein ComEA